MRLTTISGPRGAGKEAIWQELQKRLSSPPRRIVPCTTRDRRPGEEEGREYYFVTPHRFAELEASEAFVYVNDRMKHQRSGTLKTEFVEGISSFVDITPDGARKMRDLVVSQGGAAFCIFVYASREERRRRMMFREPGKSQEDIDRLLADDPVIPDPRAYNDFDLVIENPDGGFPKTVSRIVESVEWFARMQVVA